MQNVPGIALEKTSDQFKTVKFSSVKKDDKHSLFAQLFNEHANLVENELALSPVSSQDKMLKTAPLVDKGHEEKTNAAGTKAPVREKVMTEHAEEERDLDARMDGEEFEEVKEDLKEYGMSDEEIADLEKRVESEEGLTWGQFSEAIANKMAEMRKVELTDAQKDKLNSFFARFGFNEKESAALISKLENGQSDKVMAALKEKLDAMPDGKAMMFDKQEVEAFASALGFTREFSTKLKEIFGQNMLPKDVKEAFTMIRQEFAKMDKKDEQLVRAVGKVFAKAAGEDVSEASAARIIEEAVDLKPRVAANKEEAVAEAKAEIKENFKQVVTERKESLPDAQIRKNAEKPLPEKAEAKPEVKEDPAETNQNTEQENQWDNFVSKVQQDGTQAGQRAQSKAQSADATLKAGLAEANTGKTSTKAWEKVSAPKVMKQVETAVFKSLSNGGKQLTLQLTPENLGKLSVVLQVNGKEVNAQIRAESAEAARVIADNVDIIKTALENQGLKVDKLDVQTGLANNQDNKNWFGQEQHNMAREQEIMVAMRNHMKNMRGEKGEMVQDLQSIREQAINAEQGLYVIA